jgi:PhoPQ-activated pathogenicity-related protein
MPKKLFMGTIDEYWTVDGLPGENVVHYVPNVGHGPGDKKQSAELSAFFGHTFTETPYPLGQPSLTCSKREISLKVNVTSAALVDAILWSANSTDTDNGGEYTESTRMYLADDDEVFVK